MFKRKDVKKLSIIFNCEEKDVASAIHAATKYLKGTHVNTYSVARCMSILGDKLSKAVKNSPEVIYPDFGMRSDAVKKYRKDIIDLYYDHYSDLSYGFGSIAQEIYDRYRCKVSRQTIKTYIDKFEVYTHGS